MNVFFNLRQKHGGNPAGLARALSLGALGIALVWLVLLHSVAASLVRIDPTWALWLNRREAVATFLIADKVINPSRNDDDETGEPTEGDQPTARRETQATMDSSMVDGEKAQSDEKPSPERLDELMRQVDAALRVDPLYARLYRLRGQIAEMQDNQKAASASMLATARHTLHDGYALYWLMRKSFEKSNYSAAAFYADALLRSSAAPPQYVTPTLARMVDAKGAASQEIIKLLIRKPPWREGFFTGVYSSLGDAGSMLDLFVKLRDTPAPPTAQEINSYQWFLYRQKYYQLAYYVWLQFLPPETMETAGFAFNGNFETPISKSPFDWQIPTDSNVAIEIEPKKENEKDHALTLQFASGRSNLRGISELVVLNPGNYKLTGSYKGDLSGPRGVHWTISCVDGPELGRSERFIGGMPEWTGFELEFSVPEKGCVVQELKLGLAARSPSEKMLSGSIQFDDIAIALK